MASCQPAGGNSRRENQANRWEVPGFRIAIVSLVSLVAVSFGAAPLKV